MRKQETEKGATEKESQERPVFSVPVFAVSQFLVYRSEYGRERLLGFDDGRPGKAVPRTANCLLLTPMHALELTGVTKRFGSQVAVNNLDLAVPRGCIYGFIGPNGRARPPRCGWCCGFISPMLVV